MVFEGTMNIKGCEEIAEHLDGNIEVNKPDYCVINLGYNRTLTYLDHGNKVEIRVSRAGKNYLRTYIYTMPKATEVLVPRVTCGRATRHTVHGTERSAFCTITVGKSWVLVSRKDTAIEVMAKAYVKNRVDQEVFIPL